MDLKIGCSGGFLCVLFFIFLVLKLCGVITWSWWWITAPLWIPLLFGVLFIIFFLIIVTLAPDRS